MAENAYIKYIHTSLDKLNSIPIEVGNILFVEDDHSIYLDTEGKRTAYKQLITLATEEIRQNITPINNAFYFVKSTATLWNYSDEWIMISSSQPQIVFGSTSDFPVVGDNNKLYVAQNQIYRYYAGSYHLCNDESVWEII